MSDTYGATEQPVEPPVLPLDDAGQAGAAREKAAARLTRGTLRGDKTPDTALVKVTDEDSYNAVRPGQSYLDPEGNKLKRYHEVKDENDYNAVPEGAEYLDPEGTLLTKPKYEGVGFTAQTLYDMATNDRERKKALERSYPGKVKQVGDQFTVDDDGVLRKPRGMTETAVGLGAGLTAAAAPTALSVVGEIGGGIVGNLPGAIGGGIGGAMLGQSFNDGILALSGVYDRSVGEQVTETGLAGLVGGAGTVAGRVIGGATPYIKGKIQNAAPQAVADFLGVDAKALETAIRLREEGVELVPPSAWAKEAPHLHNLVEVLDRAFRTQDPLEMARIKHFEGKGADILKANGINPDGSLVNPLAKVSSRAAGESLLVKSREALASYDAQIEAEYAKRVEALKAGALQAPDKENLIRMEVEARKAAQGVIDAGYKDIEQDVAGAMKVAESGSSTGEMWNQVARKLQAVRQGYMDRAEIMYNRATTLAGGHLPNSEGLAPLAREFLEELPPDFQNYYPAAVKKIRDLAGVPKMDKEGNVIAGEWVKPPVEPDFGTLHNIRTVLRGNADWYKLNSDYKNGAYKFFAGKVDDILHPKDFSPFPAGLKVEVQPTRVHLLEDGEGSSRLLTVKDPEGKTALQATLNKYGDDAYQLNHIVNDSKWLSESGAMPRYKNLGEAAYIEAAKVARKEGKKLFAGASGETSPEARAIHQRLVEKGYASPADQHGRIEVFPESTVEKSALREAAKALDAADQFYSENMKIFNARQLKTVMDGLRAGEPADPKKLFDAVFREGHTDLTRKIMEMVGPQLAAGMRAADVQAMLDSSKSLIPGQIDGAKFAREVLERYRSNMLQDIHGNHVSSKLLKQAQNVMALEGKLDIPARPGDTALDIINRAHTAAEAAKSVAKTDPLGTLKAETEKLSKEMLRAKGQLRTGLEKDKLGKILFDPTVGAFEAADRILASEDLILSAAARFGETSPEFEMLRQVYLKRILQSAQNNLGDKLAKISPEVQNIMFRASKEQLLTLASEMEFLLGGKAATGGTGQSMMAQSRIEHPPVSIGHHRITGFIGGNVVGRAALGKYYKLVTETMNRPGLLRWIQKGVKGDEAAREMTRQQVQRLMQKGGAIGAGAAEGQYQTPAQPE